MIRKAKKFLFVEHQYPFQNFALTYEMCEALRRNDKLKVIIITPVKTDLPTGLVGDLVDWSQDHIISHLHQIYKVAPERVGIYGLVRQDDYRKLIKPIYVHSKLVIVDDEFIVTGSCNMDDQSFFYSSEICINILDQNMAKQTREKLCREHLGDAFLPEMNNNFDLLFETCKKIAEQNKDMITNSKKLKGRLVLMVPENNYGLLKKHVYYPNKVTKALFKMGVNTEDLLYEFIKKLPFQTANRSKL